MRIAIVTPYWECKGGISTVAKGLLRSLRASGHSALVLSPDCRVDSSLVGEYSLPSGLAGSVLLMARTIARNEIQIVHVHGSGSLLLHSFLAAVISRQKPRIYITFHTQPSPAAAYRKQSLRARLMARARACSLNAILRRCAGVTCVSRSLAENLARKEGLATATAIVVPNGVDADAVRAEDLRAFMDEFHLAKSFPVLVMVGVMVWDWKAAGMKTLLSALPIIQKQYPHVALVLVGDGAYRQELEDHAVKVGCAQSVVFTGNLERPSVVLAAANIYVHVAANEAFPMAVLEAMQAGLPVVASREGGTGEVIDDERTGLLVASDPAQVAGGVIRLLRDRQLATVLARTAQARCNASFTWEAICKQYLALYARI